MKVEKGVMVMKDGKAWGISFEDGQSTSYGWIDPENAPIHNPKYCQEPTDVIYDNSPYAEDLKLGEIVSVERRTEVIMVGV